MSEELAPLGLLLQEGVQLDREARKRKDRFERISVPKKLVEDYYSDGWELDKELKRKTRLKRQKAIDEILENQVWLLMYLLDYHELNSGRHFWVGIRRRGADPLQKQIDVFAKDDETVIVAECKAAASLTRKSLQKDLEEFGNLKGNIAASVHKHYGQDFKPKIIWMFFTRNIVWSKPDKERAAGLKIHVVTERELGYYLQIADHLKGAARYQFLATFLQGTKIPELADKKVPAIRGKLGGRRFYCFITTPRDLLKIAFINHRSLDHPDGAPSYQRLVSRTRMNQIKAFLDGGGFFPTNLLLNFSSEARFEATAKDPETGVTYGHLYLPDKYRSAWVIDGQHRLYGYAQLEEDAQGQNIMAIAFEKLTKAQEANLFVTINHEQKTVPKNLLDDLEGELRWGSRVPSERVGAMAARLIRLLDQDMGEPFYRRVTRQGIKATDEVCLTVPAIKDGLRASGLIGRSVLNRKEFQPGPLCGTDDIETLDRARIAINAFFDSVRANKPTRWDVGRPGYICTNRGIQAYLRLFASLISYMEADKGLNARELEPQDLIIEIEEYFDPVLKWLNAASTTAIEKHFKVQFGSGGPREYYYRLVQLVKDEYSDFLPEGMEEWEEERSEERIEAADRKLKELNVLVQKSIFERLKEEYGAEDAAYWEEGVSQPIRAEAYKRSLDDDVKDRLPPEHYLFFHEYKDIVEKKKHWPLFKELFDIPTTGEKGHSKNIQWMDRVNGLRRIPAHATEERVYRLEDLDYIDFTHAEFTKRLEAVQGESEDGNAAGSDL